MSLSVILYVIAVVCFFLACIDWPWAGKMVPVGLLFFTLGHVLAGVQFKT